MLSYRFRGSKTFGERRWIPWSHCRLHNMQSIIDPGMPGQDTGGCRYDCEMENDMNYTYLLECSDGTLYCGWTNDLEKRVKAHNSGRGAKYTKPRRPVRLVWYETFETKEEAMSREVKVKQLSRKQKDELVAHGPVVREPNF